MQRMPSLLEPRNSLLHLWTSLERKWIQPTSSPMAIGCSLNPELCHQEGGDLMVLGMVKLQHRRSTSKPIMRGRDVSKRVVKEFAISFRKIWDIVMRNSKLIGLRRSASRWTSWHKKILPIAHQLRSLRDTRKPGQSLWTHLAEMHRWNSDQTSAKQQQRCTVSTVDLEKSDLHRFLSTSIRNGIRRLLHPAHHGGSGMTTGGALKFIKVNSFWACEMSGTTEQGDLLKTFPL